MASLLKKNSTVNDADYNNFIKDFVTYYKSYYNAIKDIVQNQVAKNVMIENRWTDDFASKYAIWFNDESGVSDGSDKLNNALKKMDALFKTTCFAPVKDVAKLIGMDELGSNPMIKKAHSANDIYSILGVSKYRKTNFVRLNIKRKKGWKIVTNSNCINDMVKQIEKDIKDAKDYAERIKKLVEKEVLTPGDRCIEITGFNGTSLSTTINDINKSLDAFEKMSNKTANDAISALSTTQEGIVSGLGTVNEEQ